MDYSSLVKEIINEKQVNVIKQKFKDQKKELKQDWKNISRIYAPSGNEFLRAEYLVKRFARASI